MSYYFNKKPVGTNPNGIAYLTSGAVTHTLELVRTINIADDSMLTDPTISWETVIPGQSASPASNPVSIGGNSATATKLETPRLINGVSFDGSADITITASAPVSSVAGKTGAVTLINSDITNSASLSVYAQYKTVFQASGSHIAAKVAGTYILNTGNALVVSGGSSLYPPMIHYIRAADFPTLDGEIPKLRITAHLFTNDVAPTGNFTLGLYPVTRPATSGGAGLCIYTLGTVVAGSNGATFTAPAVDGMFQAVSADFALPADGFYVLGVLTTATIATSALVQLTACLQMRNV